jgi:hypothetical protein
MMVGCLWPWAALVTAGNTVYDEMKERSSGRFRSRLAITISGPIRRPESTPYGLIG